MYPTLLDLPRELRDEIYDYLSSVSTIPGDPIPLGALPSGARRHTQGLHSLLRVDRMLRADVLDHVKDCNTYIVSQRYRAFAGFHNMILFKPAPIPLHAQRLYLRIYIAVPERVAKPITQAARAACMLSRRSGARGKSWLNDFPKVFAVLTSELRTCLDLEDLLLEVVIKRQDSQFGMGYESTERSDWIACELVDICNTELERLSRDCLQYEGTRFLEATRLNSCDANLGSLGLVNVSYRNASIHVIAMRRLARPVSRMRWIYDRI